MQPPPGPIRRSPSRLPVAAGALLVVVAILDLVDKWESIILTLGIG